MLVLEREPGETILIGGDIEIMVVRVKGDKVCLGIKAPRNIPVHRREVYDAIHTGDPDSLEQPSELTNLPSFATDSTVYHA